jgi:hypothetical protein
MCLSYHNIDSRRDAIKLKLLPGAVGLLGFHHPSHDFSRGQVDPFRPFLQPFDQIQPVLDAFVLMEIDPDVDSIGVNAVDGRCLHGGAIER